MSAASTLPMATHQDVDTHQSATVTMASPSWWGADSIRFRGRFEGRPAHVKTYTAMARRYLDHEQAVESAIVAGASGCAPEVLARLEEGGIIMRDLTGQAKTATLADLSDPELVRRLFALKARVRYIPAPEGARRADMFEDVERLTTLASEIDAQLPSDFDALLRSVRQIADLIRPTITERVYAYGDGNTSNLLITHDGSVVLVDWDWAGVMEPAQDLGVTLVELGSTEREARSLFKLATGGSDETVFAKAMLYGYSDMVRQGLIGAITDRLEPGTLEYSKYGDWQFLRARFSLQSYRTSDFMRRLES